MHMSIGCMCSMQYLTMAISIVNSHQYCRPGELGETSNDRSGGLEQFQLGTLRDAATTGNGTATEA